MKTEYIKGDLFSTDCAAILHGCNAQGVMASGVAKTIRERYPEAYQHYKTVYDSATDKHLSSLSLGDIYPISSKGKVIINAITQKYYGRDGSRYVSYDAVEQCMQATNNYCKSANIRTLAMPQIGAGLGGGDWRIIEAIIETVLTDVQPVVYIL